MAGIGDCAQWAPPAVHFPDGYTPLSPLRDRRRDLVDVSDAGPGEQQAKQQWVRILNEGLDADKRARRAEATEQYAKLVATLEGDLVRLYINGEQRATCRRLAHTVALRMHTLLGEEATLDDQTHSAQQRSTQKVSLEELTSVLPVLDDLFSLPAIDFPLRLDGFHPNMALSAGARERPLRLFVFMPNADNLAVFFPYGATSEWLIAYIRHTVGFFDSRRYRMQRTLVRRSEPRVKQRWLNLDTPLQNGMWVLVVRVDEEGRAEVCAQRRTELEHGMHWNYCEKCNYHFEEHTVTGDTPH
jgi:hypothetical protein